MYYVGDLYGGKLMKVEICKIKIGKVMPYEL
jgi:hypothetical protein